MTSALRTFKTQGCNKAPQHNTIAELFNIHTCSYVHQYFSQLSCAIVMSLAMSICKIEQYRTFCMEYKEKMQSSTVKPRCSCMYLHLHGLNLRDILSMQDRRKRQLSLISNISSSDRDYRLSVEAGPSQWLAELWCSTGDYMLSSSKIHRRHLWCITRLMLASRYDLLLSLSLFIFWTRQCCALLKLCWYSVVSLHNCMSTRLCVYSRSIWQQQRQQWRMNWSCPPISIFVFYHRLIQSARIFSHLEP